MSNVAKKTITKSKQKSFLILFERLVEVKGSQNKALAFSGINPETASRWKADNFMTLETGKKILQAYSKAI